MLEVLIKARDLSDDYLLFARQIGVDGFDIGDPRKIPGLCPNGKYPDLDALVKLRARVRAAGMDIHRANPACNSTTYTGPDREKLEADIKHMCKAVVIYGKAGLRFMGVPHIGENPGYRGCYPGYHRGPRPDVGYRMRSFRTELMESQVRARPVDVYTEEKYWQLTLEMYRRLLPPAEEYNVRLITHPSDPPLSNSPMSPERWSRIVDEVPSQHNGLLYCVGTRHEAGFDVYKDIHSFGARGKIFHVHFRNVKGTIPATGGYEEVALDDGDMDMYRVLTSLVEAGYTGALQIDHAPLYSADTQEYLRMGWAYAVGYVKALRRKADRT